MRAGDLNRRIDIVRKTVMVRRDGTTYDAETSFTVWAKYKPIKGADRTVADAQTSSADSSFTVRRRRDFTPTPYDFIRFDGNEYDISEVRPSWVLNDALELVATARKVNAPSAVVAAP